MGILLWGGWLCDEVQASWDRPHTGDNTGGGGGGPSTYCIWGDAVFLRKMQYALDTIQSVSGGLACTHVCVRGVCVCVFVATSECAYPPREEEEESLGGISTPHFITSLFT